MCDGRVKSIVFKNIGKQKGQHSPLYNLKDFTVWCVRVPGDKLRQERMENTNSGPCIVCLKRLREFGFGKIAFSNQNGEIEIHKIKEYSYTHFTSRQRLNIKKSQRSYIGLNKVDNTKDITRKNINFSGIKI